MLKVGDKVIYGKGKSPRGAAHPFYVGKVATVIETDTDNVGFYTIRFEDGFVHKSCPYYWATKEDQ